MRSSNLLCLVRVSICQWLAWNMYDPVIRGDGCR